MTVSATLSIKALKAANLFASTEAARYYLQGVCLTVTPRFALYVATDGHRMLVHRENVADDADDNTLCGKWIIPSEAIVAIKGGTGRFTDSPATMTQISETELRIAAPKGDIVVKPIDGTFPDYHRVIPAAHSEETKAQPQQLNGLYVASFASFAKAAELLGYGALAPHFHHGEHGHPVPVTFGDLHHTFGVIMPVRNSANPWNGAPDWMNAA